MSSSSIWTWQSFFPNSQLTGFLDSWLSFWGTFITCNRSYLLLPPVPYCYWKAVPLQAETLTTFSTLFFRHPTCLSTQMPLALGNWCRHSRECLNIGKISNGLYAGFQVLPVVYLTTSRVINPTHISHFIFRLLQQLSTVLGKQMNSHRTLNHTPWELELHFCCSSLMWYLF